MRLTTRREFNTNIHFQQGREESDTGARSSDFHSAFGGLERCIHPPAILVREVLLYITPHIALFLLDVVVDQLVEHLARRLVFGRASVGDGFQVLKCLGRPSMLEVTLRKIMLSRSDLSGHSESSHGKTSVRSDSGAGLYQCLG
jgi:hypothetical protein